ncbi:MAG TPA: antitoxin Xre/MbcA/ParS toxin-binding domain-containing protein [Bryobacteraceae bacterium]|nr:antitoxin Xre/MbcA/ParS toxin-binding domain-containing protein [Bryobacteraceae bacterium]
MSLVHTQMGDWLGLQPPSTETDVLRIVEGQLAPKVIQRLIEMGLGRPEIDALIIPLRTLQHRRSRREKLSVEESDRVIRLIRVLSSAETVYKSREPALAWLRRPHPRLGGRNPLSLVRTDTGARIVEELLIQIDEGMFV